MNRYLALALKLTALSTAKQQRMGCVVVRGGAILSMGVHHHGNCAERRALRRHMNYVGAVAYVMRMNGRCSRPCNDCQKLIVRSGLRKAVFIAADNKTVTHEVFA